MPQGTVSAADHVPRWWHLRRWWRSLPPGRQDRLAVLAPVAAVLLFLVAIATSFIYLRSEEVEREQMALSRDVEYIQQRLRLHLLERQEKILHLARLLTHSGIRPEDFARSAEVFTAAYPELQSITWIDASGMVLATHAATTAPVDQRHIPRSVITGDVADGFELAHSWQRPVYLQPLADTAIVSPPTLHMQIPLIRGAQFLGTLLAEYDVDGLLQQGTPAEMFARYALSLLDGQYQWLAGVTQGPPPVPQQLPWRGRWHVSTHDVPLSLVVGDALVLRGVAYHTSPGLVHSGLFWLVGGLSVLTAWLLLVTWRHTRRRLAAQQALMDETNFRRAMENSVLTGLRVLDLQGRITYVNAAFCQMTGYSESELLGCLPPYPYWLGQDYEALSQRLAEELRGQTKGFQFRVKHKSGSVFDAYLYVSPLIDARGQQVGWMSSMTDITESNRIRDQISAAHARFTVVLESLDAAVSVTPLGGRELLFANRMYRQWFGNQSEGHLQLVRQAGVLRDELPPATAQAAALDGEDEDGLMGLPSSSVTGASARNAEVFLSDLGRWLEVRSRYLSWTDGRLAQMVIATDITQRRQAEELAAQQAERAQTASRLMTMGEMASSVAHELNQPLTAISNYCSGLIARLDSGTLNEEQMRFALEKTAHQAQRAGQVIQRIRDFVKRSEPNQTSSIVADMVSESVELASIIMRRRNVQLTHHVQTGLPPVMADAILIEQVLVNLMKNAAEAIDQAGRPAGERTVHLQVQRQSEQERDGVEFAVSDTGRGLLPQVQERLFDAFFSTKAEGMGIGLNLCRSIVESHGGRMQAQNIYNGPDVCGCRFSFWLPLA